jgi:hypothetical protein
LNFKGSVPDSKLDGFRRQWQMMIAGVNNAFRTPMTNVDELQWINLAMNNRDMEYGAWMDWLIKVTAAVYQFDPAEINFSYGNAGQDSQMFATPVEQKLKNSKDRGLRPLLDDFAHWFNVHLIWQLDPRYKLVFVGLDAKSADQAVDLSQKKVRFLQTVDEIRAEDDLPPLPDGKGDVILDATWLQFVQAKEAQDQGGDPQGMLGDMGEPPMGDDQAPMPSNGDDSEPEDDSDPDALMDQVYGGNDDQEKSFSSKDELRKSTRPTVRRTVVTYEVEL